MRSVAQAWSGHRQANPDGPLDPVLHAFWCGAASALRAMVEDGPVPPHRRLDALGAELGAYALLRAAAEEGGDAMESLKLDRIAGTAMRLAAVARDYDGVLGDGRAEAHRLGEEAYALGGNDGMLLAFRLLTIAWSAGLSCDLASAAFHPRDVGLVWVGIGTWRG